MRIWLQPKQGHTRGKVTDIYLFILLMSRWQKYCLFFTHVIFFKVLYLLWFINSVLCVGHKVIMIIKLLHQVLHAAGVNLQGDSARLTGCLKEVCRYLYSGGGTVMMCAQKNSWNVLHWLTAGCYNFFVESFGFDHPQLKMLHPAMLASTDDRCLSNMRIFSLWHFPAECSRSSKEDFVMGCNAQPRCQYQDPQNDICICVCLVLFYSEDKTMMEQKNE